MAARAKRTISKPARQRAGRRPPEERRQELLQLGVKAFAEKGIGNAKHADLAKAAKMSVSAIFDYFPNKRALVDAILNEVAVVMRTTVFTAMDQASNPENALLQSGQAIVELAVAKPEYSRVWLMWGVLYDPDIRSTYLKVESEFVDRALTILNGPEVAMADNEVLYDRACLIMGAGVMLIKLALDNPARVENYVRHVMGVLLAPIEYEVS